MNAHPYKDGSRFPGLIVGGLMAGALGLGFAAGTSTSPSSATQDVTGQSDSYMPGLSNKPSTDTSLSPSATGTSSSGAASAGTASHPSTGMYGSGTEATSSLPPNVTPGWKIRVCSEKTKADQIHFKFTPEGSKSSKGMGATGSSDSKGVGGTGMMEQTASWSRGEATEINLPSELRDADKIRIEATPSQKDKKASICLIYDDHVAKKLNFDDREVSTVKTTDNGECGC